ncbi:MAG: hypothetical protein R6X16_11240 [Anaerolineae bacterium]
METRASWYTNPAVQDAIRRFILALVVLSLALLGYDAEITRGIETTPITSEAVSGSAEIVARRTLAATSGDDCSAPERSHSQGLPPKKGTQDQRGMPV